LLAELLKVNAANQLHGDEIYAVGFAQMIGLDDVGVDQVGDELSFTDEVFDKLLLVCVILADDFDGETLDELASAVLLGFIDNSHPALKNFSDDVVSKLILNGEESHDPIVTIRTLMSSLRFDLDGQKSPYFSGIFFHFLLARVW
jgi:hypothetical protein